MVPDDDWITNFTEPAARCEGEGDLTEDLEPKVEREMLRIACRGVRDMNSSW